MSFYEFVVHNETGGIFHGLERRWRGVIKLFITSLVSLNRLLSMIFGFPVENYISIVIFYKRINFSKIDFSKNILGIFDFFRSILILK